MISLEGWELDIRELSDVTFPVAKSQYCSYWIDKEHKLAIFGKCHGESMKRVACIGECMIELREEADGRLSRGYGGDTFNTAAYLARLGTQIDYITALGDDSWSDELIAAWNAEGVGTQRVLRLPGRLPGLYIIQTDPKGERRFS